MYRGIKIIEEALSLMVVQVCFGSKLNINYRKNLIYLNLGMVSSHVSSLLNFWF